MSDAHQPMENHLHSPEHEVMMAGHLQYGVPVVHVEYARELWSEIGRLRAGLSEVQRLRNAELYRQPRASDSASPATHSGA
jgi:hypothetical protein